MATQTTNLHLTKPDYTDAADIAVINTNMDTLDAKVGAVGNTSLQAQVTTVEGQIGTVPSGKTLQGQITDNATAITNVDSDITSAMAIVVDGDTAPQNITQGSYVYIKNHYTLDTGMYHATSAISEDEKITSSNVTADSDGVANALNSKLASVEIWKYEEINFTNASVNSSGVGGYYSAGKNLTVPDGYMPVGATFKGDYTTGVYPVIYQTEQSTKRIALNCSKSVTGINANLYVHYVRIHPV